jgi:D-3-phosphoglycerate dehydrogenase
VEELARRVDILTLHVEIGDFTRAILSRPVLEALPDGAMVINTARAELMDYDALLELIPKKRLRVGLDVLPTEPPSRSAVYDHPIIRAGLVYATPHIGASTDEAQTAIAAETVRILRSFIVKGECRTSSTSPTLPGRYQLVVATSTAWGRSPTCWPFSSGTGSTSRSSKTRCSRGARRAARRSERTHGRAKPV